MLYAKRVLGVPGPKVTAEEPPLRPKQKTRVPNVEAGNMVLYGWYVLEGGFLQAALPFAV